MPNWRREIKLKQFLSTDDAPAVVREAARNFAERLKREPDYEEWGLSEICVIVEEFEGIAEDPEPTADDFNQVLAQLYDWADAERVWIG